MNAKFHFWNSLSEVMDATIQRKTGQAQTGLLPTIETAAAGAAGASHGLGAGAGYAGAIYALGKLVRSTAWRTISAASKSLIADALANGDFEGFGKIIGAIPGAVSAAGSVALSDLAQ